MRLGIQAQRLAGAVFGLLVAGGPVTAQVIRSLPTEDKVVALTFDACEAGKPTVVESSIRGHYCFLISLPADFAMLAKLTSKNQLTLPKALVAVVQGTEYFDVVEENGRIVLTPVRINRADAVRAKLEELNLSEADVADAVAWARRCG